MLYDGHERVEGGLAKQDHGLYNSKQTRNEKILSTDSSMYKETAPREMTWGIAIKKEPVLAKLCFFLLYFFFLGAFLCQQGVGLIYVCFPGPH